jgi:predicted  nucleic acid-binding Zn-ribbon protein
MTGEIENLMLEHLKHFQATLDRVEHSQTDIVARLSQVESGLSYLHSDFNRMQQSIDRLSDRLMRVEKRLELA